MRYFTSDFHLNSRLICKYAHRPFTSAEENASCLIAACNAKATKADTLVHVGDFYLRGSDSHGEEVDEGLRIPCADYLNQIKTNVVLLEGNHDDGHNCETVGSCMLIDLGSRYKNVSVGHMPSFNREYLGSYGEGPRVHVHLCGHVHDSWLVFFDKNHRVLNINVGCDVWNYEPVSDSELIMLIEYLFTHKRFDRTFVLTRSEYENFKRENDKKIREAARKRKEERDAKKGLTPEERQRRKEAAMRAKGLIK